MMLFIISAVYPARQQLRYSLMCKDFRRVHGTVSEEAGIEAIVLLVYAIPESGH
jgi:hypothetical protein